MLFGYWGDDMVIRKTPTDIENYICVSDDNISFALQKMEIYPVYMDKHGLYYKKDDEIEMLLESVVTL